MLPKIILAILSVLLGGWMIIDGSHVVMTGKYLGPDKPGPWAVLVESVGIEPLDLGGIFILLGICWIIGLISMFLKKEWSYELLIAVSVASLWYFPFGTIIAILFLIILIRFRQRLYN